MTERPIIFSAPMIRALLDGRKTQTRRVVKGVPLEWFGSGFTPEYVALADNSLCPYGQPGDQLWVRETWHPETSDPDARAAYRADCDYDTSDCGWRPSIHMPRWASRILLRVTDVRVERLQAISEADAIAEGISELPLQKQEPGAWWCADPLGNSSLHCRTPRAAFCRLWESIYGAGSWDANPWVWVIKFERVKP